ncbi:hypothetical protein NIE88_20740 [Sporolactobacillus shoreicorticis]|uniref:Uncharacterized protein n=1 Tax=Sporolactobacillus shoreicorticis TaxID=1923877 RepID=A0ABW5S710_9BACL|nr:hypothetical protein [Sporolactobacillus shoreicorticis]MCO7128176.1 hypothetical protein [Sporolactobacillus shoreicorticis]
MKRTFFSKRIGIAILVAAALVIASLTVYGELRTYKGYTSIATQQAVDHYSFGVNRHILITLKNGYPIDLDLTSVPLNVKVGAGNTLHHVPGTPSKNGSSKKTAGYVLSLTPNAYRSFHQAFLNNFGAAGIFIHARHSELVYVSI